VYYTEDLELYADGSVLASTSTAGRIQLWSFPEDCTFGSCELDLLPVSMSHSGSWSFPIAFLPNKPSGIIEIVSGSDCGMIKVWTIDPGPNDPSVVYELPVDSRAVYCLARSPDGTKIVAGGNGDITVYDYDADNRTLEILFQNVNAHDGPRSSRVALTGH
jgi:WD40 repeat protein